VASLPTQITSVEHEISHRRSPFRSCYYLALQTWQGRDSVWSLVTPGTQWDMNIPTRPQDCSLIHLSSNSYKGNI
jgi:hypothetical protein